MFLTKDLILLAYKKLIALHIGDPSRQGATQHVSAIRYFLALDEFYKKNNRPCNTKDDNDANDFINAVGNVISVCTGYYTTNFYVPLKNHNGDFSIGSNFFSVNVVKESKVNGALLLDFPRRNNPLFNVQKGSLIQNLEFYENIHEYIKSDEVKVALIIWLFRDDNFKDSNVNAESLYNSFVEKLNSRYTSDLIYRIAPQKQVFISELKKYNCTYTTDIKSIFVNKDFDLLYELSGKIQLPIDLSKFQNYFTAIKTKPFLLLAGISGTGKSRIVRELAYMSCPKLGKLQEDPTTPGNYCMIEVKPNWHDSSELLGYTSGIKNKYIITPFVKFLVKAMRYPEVPFFVCLDEMNLAPVEQYFAEYLSVLETRKMENGSIVSGSLINNDVFNNHESDIFKSLGLETLERIDMADELVQITNIENELKEFGLRLPQNIIVVGTVNMDDTTHQFSRKVIDRAMTIEMNELNFEKMFADEDRMQYTENHLDAALFISESVSANHALELISEDADQLRAKTIEIMQTLDEKLKDTPFRVAYRVQNELVLYYYNLCSAYPDKSFEELFAIAVDSMLKMKVLPRIEGDEDMVKKPLKALEAWTAESGYTTSNPKIKEMLARLDHAHYTSYWP